MPSHRNMGTDGDVAAYRGYDAAAGSSGDVAFLRSTIVVGRKIRLQPYSASNRRVIMRSKIGVSVLAAIALSWPAWAQSQAQPAASTAPSGSNDPIVQMRMEVAAANKTYDKKVSAAKKVYDHKKAEAAKERDASIAAAHHGAS